MHLGAGGLDLVRPRPVVQSQVQRVAGIALCRGRHVVGLARPVHVLRRDQLLGKQLFRPLEVPLRQSPGGARAREPGPPLLDLIWTPRQEVSQLGLRSAHAGLGLIHTCHVLRVIETRHELSGLDRVALVHQDRHDPVGDLAADADHDLGLDGPHTLDRRRDVARRDRSDRDRHGAEEKKPGDARDEHEDADSKRLLHGEAPRRLTTTEPVAGGGGATQLACCGLSRALEEADVGLPSRRRAFSAVSSRVSSTLISGGIALQGMCQAPRTNPPYSVHASGAGLPAGLRQCCPTGASEPRRRPGSLISKCPGGNAIPPGPNPCTLSIRRPVMRGSVQKP